VCFSVPLSLFLSSSFLIAARIEQPYSCLPDPRCRIATTGRMKFRLPDEGEAANAVSKAGKRVEGKLETRAERNGNRTDFRNTVVSRFTVTRAYVIFPLRGASASSAGAASSTSRNIACTPPLSGLSPQISVKTRTLKMTKAAMLRIELSRNNLRRFRCDEKTLEIETEKERKQKHSYLLFPFVFHSIIYLWNIA
jgi:hypothetical protein